MKHISFIGFGGLGGEILQALRSSEFKGTDVVIYDDMKSETQVAAVVDELSTFGGRVDQIDPSSTHFVMGIGDSYGRESIHRSLVRAGMTPLTIIDSFARVSSFAKIGPGVTILMASMVSPNAIIGEGVHVGFNCIVAHDSVVGDFSTIGPGSVIPGNCTVGERTTLGASVSMKPGVSIGSDVTVGVGSVVIKDVPDGRVVAGNPLRILR